MNTATKAMFNALQEELEEYGTQIQRRYPVGQCRGKCGHGGDLRCLECRRNGRKKDDFRRAGRVTVRKA